MSTEATAGTMPKTGLFEGLKMRAQVSNQILDGALATALIGSGANEKARKYIKVGAATTAVGAGTWAGLSFTGYVGPMVMGTAVLPLAAKATVAAGVGVMFYGIFEGFKDGWNRGKTIKAVSMTEAVEAAKASGKVVDITETVRVVVSEQPQGMKKDEKIELHRSEHETG